MLWLPLVMAKEVVVNSRGKSEQGVEEQKGPSVDFLGSRGGEVLIVTEERRGGPCCEELI